MISISILRESIDLTQLIGAKKNFLSIRLIRTKENHYKNDWMVTQAVTSEAYKSGNKGNILGNGRNIGAAHETELIEASIDTTKLDKSLYYRGQKGSYINLKLAHPTKEEAKTADADYIVWQEVTSEEDRLNFKKGPKVGAARKSSFRKKTEEDQDQEAPSSQSQSSQSSPSSSPPSDAPPTDEDDIPF